ncbi:rhodanese-related sulfurtransferase [Roseibium aggregatum]|uniref:oxygen-dependent tRNA uridine(34) hydroxylase TrhO n=1 Tax=Roseibium aggregatum TaxID=187304 RepID=UPI001A8E4294|nr:rhodanese-related sulfurtransferase [Roseibium aggregatum]MBN8182031.1 rhodanese-related sulfurtransferase [Roseibium aggregatum]UES43881.1 rhodanese-related sulfurtransferase [Roseibium aggregatum]
MNEFLVAALYMFTPLDDFEAMRSPLKAYCEERDVRGSLLLAGEGINGTICGPEAGVREVLAHLRSDPRLAGLNHKEAWTHQHVFKRMKVRLKQEIVRLAVDGIDPNEIVGEYVKPEDWNALISDPDVVVIDTRNDYEFAFGTFERALNPKTQSFREFPAWVDGEDELQKKPKVAMFCTGGIRCEKATAWMLKNGFEEVYHLEGGILNYLEKVPEADSLWKGECFVFDDRVSVDHQLQPRWGEWIPEEARHIINEDTDYEKSARAEADDEDGEQQIVRAVS